MKTTLLALLTLIGLNWEYPSSAVAQSFSEPDREAIASDRNFLAGLEAQKGLSPMPPQPAVEAAVVKETKMLPPPIVATRLKAAAIEQEASVAVAPVPDTRPRVKKAVSVKAAHLVRRSPAVVEERPVWRQRVEEYRVPRSAPLGERRLLVERAGSFQPRVSRTETRTQTIRFKSSSQKVVKRDHDDDDDEEDDEDDEDDD